MVGARHQLVALNELFASRIVVLGGYGVFANVSARATALSIVHRFLKFQRTANLS